MAKTIKVNIPKKVENNKIVIGRINVRNGSTGYATYRPGTHGNGKGRQGRGERNRQAIAETV